MAKQTGIGANLYANQYNISGDVGAIDTLATSRTLIDVTDIEDDAPSRLPGIADGMLGFTGYFDRDAGHVHDALGSAFGTAQVQLTASLGTAIGDAAASVLAQKASYTTTRGQDGSLAVAVQASSSGGYGLDWGRLLNARASATGTASTTVDNGAASSNGATGYLHITAVAAGTPTVIVQHAPDNATWATLTGLSFTASSTATYEFKTTAAGLTVDRYLRYNVTGGTATFALNVVRNP